MSTLEEMLNRVKIYNTSGYYDHQDQRNVKQKLLSFRASLQNSYQAEWIRRLGADFKVDWSRRFRCLLNPDKLKESYDMKELSIENNTLVPEKEKIKIETKINYDKFSYGLKLEFKIFALCPDEFIQAVTASLLLEFPAIFSPAVL